MTDKNKLHPITDFIQELETKIGEALVYSVDTDNNSAFNIFNRPFKQYFDSELDALFGLSMTGLRCAAIVGHDFLNTSQTLIRNLNKHRLPAVLHINISGACSEQLSSQSSIKQFLFNIHEQCIILQSHHVQMSIDFVLIAHKLAEFMQVPVVHLYLESPSCDHTGNYLPSANLIKTFLGRSDDRINSPTASQAMVFGKTRRRIYNWYNFDEPCLHGALKDGLHQGLEQLSRNEFYSIHYPEFAKQLFEEFEVIFERKYNEIETFNTQKANYLVLCEPNSYANCKKTISNHKKYRKLKIGCLTHILLSPFPEAELAQILAHKKGLTILDGIESLGSTLPFIRQLLNRSDKNQISIHRAEYTNMPHEDQFISVFENMMAKLDSKSRFYLDAQVNFEKSVFPKKEIERQKITRLYPGIENKFLRNQEEDDTKRLSINHKSVAGYSNIPFVVRQYGDLGPPYSQLTRFYDQQGLFYQTNQLSEINIDPFQAISALPSATACFAPGLPDQNQLLEFDSSKCTACGACYMVCPNSAMPPIALDTETLVRGAANIATLRGQQVNQLTPFIKQFAKALTTSLRKEDRIISVVGDFWNTCIDTFVKKIPGDQSKQLIIKQELETLSNILCEFPIARTEFLFSQPESRNKFSGQLFSIAIDPIACTSCGDCVDSCPESALNLIPHTPELFDKMQSNFRIWESLPDTHVSTINKLLSDKEYNSFAATLLSRNFYMSLVGSVSNQETDRRTKTALHLISSVLESILQERITEFNKKLLQTLKSLNETIHSSLSESIPSENLDDLIESMATIQDSRIGIDEIIQGFKEQHSLKLIETAEFKRRLDLVHELKDLQWTIINGPTGNGRASYGVSIHSKSITWAKTHPYNPFVVPTIIQDQDNSFAFLSGLFQGMKRHLIDNLKLLRRASLEIQNSFKFEIHALQIAQLTWDQLDSNEKMLLNPMVIVMDSEQLIQENTHALLSILASDLPIKIFIFNSGIGRIDCYPSDVLKAQSSMVLSAISQRNAFVFQGSLYDTNYLYQGLVEGIQTKGPAVYFLMTPEDSLLSTDTLGIKARIAMQCMYKPNDQDKLLVDGLDLKSNPQYQNQYCTVQINPDPKNVDKDNDKSYSLSFADWAFNQPSWKSHFTSIEKMTSRHLVIPDFLNSKETNQADKLPYITVKTADGNTQNYEVSSEIIECCRASLHQWDTLREMGGLNTAHPQKFREEIISEQNEIHQKELDKIKKEHTAKIAGLEEEIAEKLRFKLKEKLIMLAEKKRQKESKFN